MVVHIVAATIVFSYWLRRFSCVVYIAKGQKPFASVNYTLAYWWYWPPILIDKRSTRKNIWCIWKFAEAVPTAVWSWVLSICWTHWLAKCRAHFGPVCHQYVIPVPALYANPVPTLCQPYASPMPPLCHPYATPLCQPYATPMPPYATLCHPMPPPYATPMPPYATPMPPYATLCHPYATLCHPMPTLCHPYAIPLPPLLDVWFASLTFPFFFWNISLLKKYTLKGCIARIVAVTTASDVVQDCSGNNRFRCCWGLQR